MSKNKNARPDAATSEQAAGTDLAGHVSTCNFTTSHCKSRCLIFDRLGIGPENGKGLRQLSDETGQDPREVRRQIARERKAGKLILSDNQNGYFKPSSEHEIRRFIKSMSHRSREIAAVSRAAEDALVKMTGQATLEGW
ncbi:hypothetical protein [uncultured Dysosmobacter sp.]|uniref:hypothetical protein n=1 Tax=uncultured Dysosmobacter sp. TaxID=2591384 RepID=UPI00261F573A|nr:hypothetical protein [uncultured Dysosmobacter sp.]